jgi:hypothetical protein
MCASNAFLSSVGVQIYAFGHRRWPDVVKAQAVAETLRPGATVNAMAVRFGVQPNQSRLGDAWRRTALWSCKWRMIIHGEKPMTSADGCSRWRRVALILATICLSGCVTGASEVDSLGACPPVVGYSRAFQERAAEELALLPESSAVAEMLSDYAVMR